MTKEPKELDPLRVAILGLLSIRPMSGYDLTRSYKRALDRIWQAPAGQIYPALRTMEREGFLEVSVEIQDTRPNRKVYRLSALGQRAFQAWLERPVRAPVVHHEFLHKLFVMDHLPLEQRRAMIESYVQNCQSWVDHMKLVDSKLRGSLDGPQGESVYFQMLAIGHLRNVIEAEVRSAKVIMRYADGPHAGGRRRRPRRNTADARANPFGDLYLFPEDPDQVSGERAN